jgi:serine phosphatase RsbU (regulator of sigma subunit)/tetratricopeptide (TPR) repeat protein
MKRILSVIFTIIISWNSSIKAQAVSGGVDELTKYLETWNNESIDDTARLDAFNKAIWIIKDNNLDSALIFIERSLDYAKERGIKNKIARATNIKGVIFKLKGREKEALEYYQNSLSIYKEINDLRGITIQNNNIATIFASSGDFQKAFDNHMINYNLFEEVEDTALQIVTMNNLSYECYYLDKLDSSYFFLKQAISLSKKHSKSYDLATLLRRLVGHYRFVKDIDSAVIVLKKSYKLDLKNSNIRGQAAYFKLFSEILYEQKKYRQSLKMVEKAIELTNEFNAGIGDASLLFYKYNLYKELGDTKNALLNYELHNELKDTLEKLSANQDVVKIQFNQEYEIKKQLDSLKHLDEIRLQQAETKAREEEIKAQKKVETALFIGIFLVIGFLGFVYKQLNTTKKQKVVIEEKQQEISDSINYAKRIQDAMMTSSVYLKDTLPKSFIFFKPKDVVSGDFYWIHKDQDENIFFTVADCTGHGVPGAFMSMIGTSLLNEIIIEKGIKDTDKILFEMRTQIIKSLNQEEEGAQKDGMDISLCKLNMKKKIVEFSGAHNSLIHVSGEELKTYRGDHQPVGLLLGDKKPFTKHKVKLKKDDMLYIYSDGYQDQFGGKKGKKYMAAKFKQQLSKLSKETEDQQLVMLGQEFSSWINDYEQIDDVCVMGVRII